MQAQKSFASSITQKLVHSPSVKMKKARAAGRDELLEITGELFEISLESEPKAGEETDKKK